MAVFGRGHNARSYLSVIKDGNTNFGNALGAGTHLGGRGNDVFDASGRPR